MAELLLDCIKRLRCTNELAAECIFLEMILGSFGVFSLPVLPSLCISPQLLLPFPNHLPAHLSLIHLN